MRETYRPGQDGGDTKPAPLAPEARNAIDAEAEHAYWREAHTREPYYTQGTDFEHYAPAYRVGYLGRVKYDGRAYEEIEDELAADYAQDRGDGKFTWEDARSAARAAWDRADRRIRGVTGN
jgi:hypothetical protein